MCLTCASVQQLPLQQWSDAQQQGPRNGTTQLPWGQEVAFGAVDYADVAEVVCKCLAGEEALLALPSKVHQDAEECIFVGLEAEDRAAVARV